MLPSGLAFVDLPHLQKAEFELQLSAIGHQLKKCKIL
jgi:hypothetical protein